MKRAIALLCLFSLLFVFTGCKTNDVEIISPVQLYYCNENIDFHSDRPVIASEIREFHGWEENIKGFLNEYLSGPVSAELSSPFPHGGWILSLAEKDNEVTVTLSSNFGKLSANEFTIACACISNTIFNLMNLEIVHFEVFSSTSVNNKITMTRDNLILFDNTQTQ